MNVVVASFLCVVVACGAGGQVTDPGQLFDLFRAERQDSPVSEDVSVHYRVEGVSDRQERYTVRYNPGAAPAILLELEPLRVFADAREIIATSSSNPDLYWARETGEAGFDLAGILLHMPPVALPTLQLLRGDLAYSSPLPQARGVLWARVEATQRSVATAVGESRDGPVRVVIDTSNWQLQRIEAELRSGERVAHLTVSVSPSAPTDPSTWRQATTGLARVETLAELYAPPGALKVGSTCPDIAIGPIDETWRLGSDVKKGPVVLVLVRSVKGEIKREDIDAATAIRDHVTEAWGTAEVAVRTIVFADDTPPAQTSLRELFPVGAPLVTHSRGLAARLLGQKASAVMIVEKGMTVRLIEEMKGGFVGAVVGALSEQRR